MCTYVFNTTSMKAKNNKIKASMGEFSYFRASIKGT